MKFIKLEEFKYMLVSKKTMHVYDPNIQTIIAIIVVSIILSYTILLPQIIDVYFSIGKPLIEGIKEDILEKIIYGALMMLFIYAHYALPLLLTRLFTRLITWLTFVIWKA